MRPDGCWQLRYAGSEATGTWGLTDGDRKTTGVDARVLPRAIVYDAELTRSLPVELSVASGLNALAHCVDAMWGPRADPVPHDGPIGKMLAACGRSPLRAIRRGARTGRDLTHRPGVPVSGTSGRAHPDLADHRLTALPH